MEGLIGVDRIMCTFCCYLYFILWNVRFVWKDWLVLIEGRETSVVIYNLLYEMYVLYGRADGSRWIFLKIYCYL